MNNSMDIQTLILVEALWIFNFGDLHFLHAE